ncbi:zinc finger protein 232 [Dipodomys merriami]|uniref:zinc finger protein 232 n=1 Tax=Dipodomys merriami TaxID=94247 RepID=UPI0038560DE2
MISSSFTVCPQKDSSWCELSAELDYAKKDMSSAAANTLVFQGTQEQEKIVMLEPNEEDQSWEYETRLPGNPSTSQEVFRQRFIGSSATRRLQNSGDPTDPTEVWESQEPQPSLKSEQVYCDFPSVVTVDGPEPREAGLLPQPLVTKAESQVLSEILATDISTVKVTWEIETTLKQQQRSTRAERPKRSSAQRESSRLMVVTPKKTPMGNKDYEGSKCGEAFMYSSLLAVYQRIQSGEKPFQCSNCGKTFNHRSNFIQHQRIHTGEKPYKCKECGKAFRLGTHLVKHWRTHSGEKSYRCGECGKAFSQSWYLSQHLNVHSGEKPFRYRECGKAYQWNSTLLRHGRVHASREFPQCAEDGRASRQTCTFV